ncbi:MAG: hypothetical protein HC927_08075, partial [Deltaproteobacteria bacterium]|nr:hypothetical protein [Deltaproteobacteria bacterium]
ALLAFTCADPDAVKSRDPEPVPEVVEPSELPVVEPEPEPATPTPTPTPTPNEIEASSEIETPSEPRRPSASGGRRTPPLGSSESTHSQADAEGECCMTCDAGKACGDACIDKNKQCNIIGGCACDAPE